MERLTALNRRAALLKHLANNLAHELNNPLAVIIGKAEQIRDRATSGELDAAMLLKAADKIHANGMRISQIVTSLQNYHGKGTNQAFEVVAVSTLLEEVAAAWESKYAGKDVTLKISDTPATLLVECKRVELSRAIMNLLDNAAEVLHGKGGGWIRLEAGDEGNDIAIRIVDSGAPIEPSLREKLLDPFYSTKKATAGAGLGLNVTESIVNSHQGLFFLDAEESQNTFVIRIPKTQTKETGLNETAERKNNPGRR